MESSKKQLLILGATGFIGRNCVEFFSTQKQYSVRAAYHLRPPFDTQGVEWVQADLTQVADVKRVLEGADIVVQAAATTSGVKDIVNRPYIHITDNAVMNSLVFREAFELKVQHLIFFSCSIMYPSAPKPIKESDFDANTALNSNYFGAGWTKIYLEKMAEFYSRIGATRFTVLRHSNIYGPHDKFDLERSHVMGATITKVLTSKDGRVVVWGDGQTARDLLYVDDLLSAVDLSLKTSGPKYRLLNIGSGQAVTINELVQTVMSQSGADLKVVHDTSQPSINTQLSLDCSKAHAELGWRPRVDLERGITKTLAWYQSQHGH